MTLIDKTINLIPQMSPEEFAGLCMALNVRMLTDRWDKETKKAIPRDSLDIILDCAEALNKLSNKDLRMYYHLIKDGIKSREAAV